MDLEISADSWSATVALICDLGPAVAPERKRETDSRVKRAEITFIHQYSGGFATGSVSEVLGIVRSQMKSTT